MKLKPDVSESDWKKLFDLYGFWVFRQLKVTSWTFRGAGYASAPENCIIVYLLKWQCFCWEMVEELCVSLDSSLFWEICAAKCSMFGSAVCYHFTSIMGLRAGITLWQEDMLLLELSEKSSQRLLVFCVQKTKNILSFLHCACVHINVSLYLMDLIMM